MIATEAMSGGVFQFDRTANSQIECVEGLLAWAPSDF